MKLGFATYVGAMEASVVLVREAGAHLDPRHAVIEIDVRRPTLA